MTPDGIIWPDSPPEGRLCLKELFPRIIGKLTAGYYRSSHIQLVRMSQKQYGLVLASFQVKYLVGDDSEDMQVWIHCRWPLKRGQLFKLGTETHKQGRLHMEWETTVPYAKLVKKRKFLLKLAEVIGRARAYP